VAQKAKPDAVKVAAEAKAPHQRVRRPDLLPDEFVGGFVMFLREHAIVGLAVGFAIGTQAQSLVNSLVKSFILPLVELFFGQNLASRDFTLHFHSHHARFVWGSFAVALVTFLFVLLTIYLLVKVLKLDRLDLPKDKK